MALSLFWETCEKFAGPWPVRMCNWHRCDQPWVVRSREQREDDGPAGGGVDVVCKNDQNRNDPRVVFTVPEHLTGSCIWTCC